MVSRDQLFGTHSPAGFTAWAKEKQALDARAGVSNWTVHDIRRTVATRMADIGVQPHIIEAVLNHQSGHKAGPAGIYARATSATFAPRWPCGKTTSARCSRGASARCSSFRNRHKFLAASNGRPYK
jgi:hypothetical protein